MSSQPIDDLTSGLIWIGFVAGMRLSVFHKKKTIRTMNRIMNTPDHELPKSLTLSRKL